MANRGKFWVCLVLLLAGALVAQAVDCTTCKRKISGKYVQWQGGAFCSNECLVQKLPKCAACRKPLSGGYLSNASGKQFCSEACISTTWPSCEICSQRVQVYVTIEGHVFCKPHADGPRCAECALPFGEGVRLNDKRYLCSGCKARAVMSTKEARDPYEQARRALQGLTGIEIAVAPKLTMVDRMQLHKYYGAGSMDDESGMIRGFYDRHTETTRSRSVFMKETVATRVVSEDIYILYGQTRENFMATAVHELMHDVVADHFPKVKDAPEWVNEGICQYMSAMYCRKVGYAATLKTIEESPHVVYGDGYRYFKKQLGDGNWTGLRNWLKTTDMSRLPRSVR